MIRQRTSDDGPCAVGGSSTAEQCPTAPQAGEQGPSRAREHVREGRLVTCAQSLESCNQLVDALREQTMLTVEGPDPGETCEAWARRVDAARRRVVALLAENETTLVAAARAVVASETPGP